MCFDFLSQGCSEGLAGSWVLPALCYSQGRALFKSLGLSVRGVPGAWLPCPATQQRDHKTDTHSSHYWLGFAIGAELGEEVGWCYKLPGVPHAWGHLALEPWGDVRWQHLLSPVRLCPIAFSGSWEYLCHRVLLWQKLRQLLMEVTLLNTQQCALTWEEKIWFSSSCSNG